MEWDAFRATSKTELFRKTKLHAIDVLKGEPLIKLHVHHQKRRRHQTLSRKKAPSVSTTNTVNQGKRALKASTSGQAPLPERIRINSPAIIKAFTDVSGEKLSGPFLLFRPFGSLLYYEQGFRDLITEQENKMQGTYLYNDEAIFVISAEQRILTQNGRPEASKLKRTSKMKPVPWLGWNN